MSDESQERPVSPYDGKACPKCGARLRVTHVYPTDIPLKGGGTYATSEYECEGNPPHRYADMADLPVPGRHVTFRLVRQEDEPEE